MAFQSTLNFAKRGYDKLSNEFNKFKNFYNDFNGNSSGDLSNASFGQGVNNFLTGNLDYERNLYMSNTQYQRAVNDIAAAGLNPGMLLSGNGEPAPAFASHSSNGFGALTGFLSSVVSSAMGLARESMHNDTIEELTEKKLADTRYLNEVNNAARLERSSNRDRVYLANASTRAASAREVADMYVDSAGYRYRKYNHEDALHGHDLYEHLYNNKDVKSKPEWYDKNKYGKPNYVKGYKG